LLQVIEEVIAKSKAAKAENQQGLRKAGSDSKYRWKPLVTVLQLLLIFASDGGGHSQEQSRQG
jgi:hypothetical protein